MHYYQSSPENSSHQDKDGIGNGTRFHGNDVLGVEEYPDGGVGNGGEKEPDKTEQALTILCARVSQEKSPGKLSGDGEIPNQGNDNIAK